MRLDKPPFLLLAILANASAASAAVYDCPLPNAPPLAITATNGNELSISTSTPPGYTGPTKDYLCLLSLRVPSLKDSERTVRKPVGRTYGGRAWEVKAGPFAEIVGPPVCGGSDCTFVGLPSVAAGEDYILTSYSYGADARVQAARFLEQSTFGASLDEIDALVSRVIHFCGHVLCVRYAISQSLLSLTRFSFLFLLFHHPRPPPPTATPPTLQPGLPPKCHPPSKHPIAPTSASTPTPVPNTHTTAQAPPPRHHAPSPLAGVPLLCPNAMAS